MTHFKRLLHDKARLRHGTLRCVYKHEYAVDHHHNALYLARKICVSGGVYNVYFNALVMNGSVFCKYGYTALALQIVAVHYALFNRLIVAEGMALPEQCVYKRCLAVVYMGDNRHVS